MSSGEVSNLLRLTRAYAAKQLPWFAPALYRCRIDLTEAVTVAAIDPDYNLYWNPRAVDRIVAAQPERADHLRELAFIWIHEISHVLRRHPERRAENYPDADRWNRSADLEINDARWAGTRHPTAFPPLLPRQFQLPEGQTAEWYYRQPQLDRGTFGWQDCGSGAHGETRPWELSSSRQLLSDVQREVTRRRVAERLSRQSGNLPGGWDVWIQQTLKNKVDWRQLLRQRLANAVARGSGQRIDYDYRRPGRRRAAYDPFILPSLRGRQKTELAVVLDTSGSTLGAPLDQAFGEIYEILRATERAVTLIPCDARAYQPVRLESVAQLRSQSRLKGGGGTDLRKGIAAALDLRPRPDTILVLTDGYTPYPTELPAVPILFGILRSTPAKWTGGLPPNPPFGEDLVVEIRV